MGIERTRGWAGCLAVVAGFCTGYFVWESGAGPGARGGFEGERYWSLLYVEGPLMVFGVPALALAAWALVGGMLRARDSVAAVVVVLVPAGAGWGCLEWPEVRTEPFTKS
ncbi:hypothetical protein [Streptomyces sp. V1I1]|uniref:hypothetical protein n=1 Tax=Streptomyces sp. V1I1 TaxID=3042272 RepID=UPI002781E6DB|nr:hypothetical protein [Streptomyces sp. V1I1]MDQ0941014.1 hypothetical protein [Streptomyces sp. V1I1]